jgi:hypothetical protein
VGLRWRVDETYVKVAGRWVVRTQQRRPDQVLIRLANATDWAKEIWAFNLCSGRLGSVFQEDPNSTPRSMLLSRASCREGADSIVFRKPGFFGIWHDVGHFDSGSFWSTFGGTVATFTWTVD